MPDRSAPPDLLNAAQVDDRRHAAILNAALDGVITINRQGLVVEFNPAAEMLFGYSRGQALGRPLEQLIIPPGLRPRHQQGLARFLATGESSVIGRRVEMQALRSDASEIPVEVSIIQVGSGDSLLFTGYIRDLSERKAAEEAIRASEERFRSVVEMSSDAIFLADGQGILHYASPAAERVLGYNGSALIGRQGLDLVHPDDLACAQMILQETVSRPGEHVSFALRARFVDGSIRWVDGICTNYLANPAVRAIVVNFRDVTERKVVEMALRESEARYRAIFENAVEGFYQSSRDGQFLAVNPALARIYGYSSPQDLITSVTDIGHQLFADPNRRNEFVRQLETDGSVIGLEFQIRRKDGTVAWVSESARAVRDAGGSLRYFEGTVEDITARKLAEERLRESAARLQEAQTIAHVGSFFWDLTTGSVSWSNELYRIYGLTPGEPLGLDEYLQRIHPDDRERVEGTVRRAIESRLSYEHEYQIVRRSGETRWVHARGECVTDSNGTVLALQGTCQDVTERKLADESLALIRDDLARQVDSLTRLHEVSTCLVGVGDFGTILQKILDAAIEITRADTGCIQLLDSSTHRPRIVAHRGFTHEFLAKVSSAPPDQSPCGPVMASQRRVVIEDVARDPNFSGTSAGEILIEAGVHAAQLTPLRSRQGVLLGILSTQYYQPSRPSANVLRLLDLLAQQAADFLERNRAEEQRRALETQIQHAQKLESLGVLAGGIAHDFNNLLTSMMGYAALAQMQLSSESPATPMLREIEKAAQRAADLTQQMLAYSGRGKFVIQTMGLDTVVLEMAKLLGTVISKKATLKMSLDPAPIDGDPTQLRQIIMNLITNASDALDGQSGVIHVRTGVRTVDAATLRSPYFPDELAAGTYAFIEVEDTGIGMTDETRERIFDPFFTTKFLGRGLGLAAVLGIVRGHHGTIKVTSAPGQGTTFELYFPYASGVARGLEATARPESPTGQGTLLIVEDEPSVANFARMVLEGAGFNILEANDGRAGLDLFSQRRQEIDAILLDLTMPRLDGMEFLQELRRLDSDVVVLVMSGYSESEVATRFKGLGASGFLQKPFYPHDLLTQLAQCLRAKSQRVE